MQLPYATLHTAVVGEVTTATIATTPKNTAPTTFQPISGFALPPVIHNNQPLLYVSYSETSAAALCGTTGTCIASQHPSSSIPELFRRKYAGVWLVSL